ncbi:MAG: 30S ribosomal protein S6 [Candidatus Puniceispirillales bacterium]
MAFYESVVITRPELTESQVENLTNELITIISNENGKVHSTENWGLRNLAYKINKNKKGHYFLINIDCNPSVIFEYERQMRINEDIIRFLTIKIDHFSDKPSILSKNIQDSIEPSLTSKKAEDNLEKKEI